MPQERRLREKTRVFARNVKVKVKTREEAREEECEDESRTFQPGVSLRFIVSFPNILS
jgi:hypothetical protein